jgi:ribosomal protein S21
MLVHAVVVPEPFESIDSLVRRFTKATRKSNVLTELRRHEAAMSPSTRKKGKRIIAQSRRRSGEVKQEKFLAKRHN